MLNPGTILKQKYEILNVIGHGGMSIVYRARNILDGTDLAIKDALRDNNSVMEQSLAAEGRVLMNLSNPHLPRIYDIIENKDSILLVMDFVEGKSLDKVLARYGAQPVDRVLNWGMQMCEVLDYLHGQNPPIIYRDLKPSNLILQPSGNLTLIDFGTARTQKLNTYMDSDTINIGTSGFAAPEQYGGLGQSDARTDIFCLGATLYNLVTGHSPSDPPKGVLPLDIWIPGLSQTPIQEIIRKCTSNDPANRYQSAMELFEALRLASIGAFHSSSKGKTGRTGGLWKTDWQRQEVKRPGASSNGLSGLLSWTGILNARSEQTATAQWASPPQVALKNPEKQSESAARDQTSPAPQNAQPVRMDIRRIGECFLVVAIGLLLLTVVLAVFHKLVGAMVCALLAVASAVVAAVQLLSQKES